MLQIALPFGISTPENKRDCYRRALRQAGLEPLETTETLANAAGLLLAGGGDIDPALYGALPDPRLGDTDPERDALETALLREALDRDLPVLAICRGLQLLNAAAGGTLTQHIEGHRCPKQREAHRIEVAPGSRLESILETRDYGVNSSHHQCADQVASSLVVAATAPDGVVEALECPGRLFVLAVQWHPEARMDGPDARLFDAFRRAVSL